MTDSGEEHRARMHAALETLAGVTASEEARAAAGAELQRLQEEAKTLPFEIAAEKFQADAQGDN